MARILERTVLFADLRGSTSLYGTLGNAAASAVITQALRALCAVVASAGGVVVKTLGDGLMAVFERPQQALDAAQGMHAALATAASQPGATSGWHGLRLQVGMARGEVVEVEGDCYGDAVNVAARLLEHAGDSETLVTAEVIAGFPARSRKRFRPLDRLQLRGRAEPVQVHVLGRDARGGEQTTQFSDQPPAERPLGLRLSWLEHRRDFDLAHLPLIIGRSPLASFSVDDSRVSRSHARIDWHGGAFQLTDLSFNGTYVRFGGQGEVLPLRRGTCALHGHGAIGLGASPLDLSPSVVRIEVLHGGAPTAASAH
jgi:class 3 adenylate cyclase